MMESSAARNLLAMFFYCILRNQHLNQSQPLPKNCSTKYRRYVYSSLAIQACLGCSFADVAKVNYIRLCYQSFVFVFGPLS